MLCTGEDQEVRAVFAANQSSPDSCLIRVFLLGKVVVKRGK
jgi:hypothetical protein